MPEFIEAALQPESLGVGVVVFLIVLGSLWYQKTRSGSTGAQQGKHKGTLLDQYSTNFTQLARDNELSPTIGRVQEVQHLVQVLSRKTKNNALLLGPPGVGKTAVVERLAHMVIAGEVPDSIANKELIALDLSSLVSGTKYRGELEERLDALRHEFQNSEESIILFIDEIQQLAQANGSEGGLNPADILKPELARGRLQVIGATTYDEYEEYIQPDETLERRFQPVHIHEPSRDETLEILEGIKKVFEEFHHVQYAPEVMEAIVDLSSKHIQKRFLPDKAIDVLDESGVRERLLQIRNSTGNQVPQTTPTVTVDTVKEVISEWAEVPMEELG